MQYIKYQTINNTIFPALANRSEASSNMLICVCFQAVCLIFLQAFVISSRLVVFVVEVLDSLVVDEGVHCLVSCLCVGLVHLHAKLGPPLSDCKGEGTIDYNSAERDSIISRPACVGQNPAHHAQLHHSGHHVEHHPLKNKGDATGPTIQSLTKSTRLSVQVEAQVKIV